MGVGFVKYLFFVGALALLFFLASEYRRVTHLFRTGKELAANARAFEQYPEVAAHGLGPKVLFIGDSTAVGTGASDARESTAGRYGALYPAATVVNKGRNGMRTSELAQKLDEVEDGAFDLVVLQIGGNDIVYFTDFGELETSLDTVLQKAQTKLKDASGKVILLSCGDVGAAPFFPRVVAPLWSRRTRQVRVIFLKAAEKYGARYVDLYVDKEHDVFRQDPKRYYAADSFHPSSEGYRVWFEEIQKAL